MGTSEAVLPAPDNRSNATISRWMRIAAIGVALVGAGAIALHFVTAAQLAGQQEQLRGNYRDQLADVVTAVEGSLRELAARAQTPADELVREFYRTNPDVEIDRVLSDRTAEYDLYLLDAFDESFDLPASAAFPFVMRSLIQQSAARDALAAEAVRGQGTDRLLLAVPVVLSEAGSGDTQRKWIAVAVYGTAALTGSVQREAGLNAIRFSIVQDLQGIAPLLIAGTENRSSAMFEASLDLVSGWKVQVFPSDVDEILLTQIRSRLDLVVGAGLLASGLCLLLLTGWRRRGALEGPPGFAQAEPDPAHPVELPIFVAKPEQGAPRPLIDPKLNLAATEAASPAAKARPAPASDPAAAPQELDATLFRSYDIRGPETLLLAGDFPERAGRAFATLALRQGESAVHLCRDGRRSSPEIAERFKAGVLATGCDLIDLGIGPTPLLGFAVETNNYCSSGAMVTGSHNPAGENGLKLSLQREMLQGDAIQNLRKAMLEGEFATGDGQAFTVDYERDYLRYLVEDIVVEGRPRVVVDGGNGAAGPLAVRALEALGCDVKPLYCDVDGAFPNRPPDNTRPENLAALIERVRGKADLGIAFDGDGDRLVAVTRDGAVILPDRLMMLIAADILVRQPGATIVYDVKCSRALPDLVARLGGRPVMCRSGRTYVAHEVRKHRAPFGGEFSGHLFFPDRWYPVDDAIYAGARLIELVSRSRSDLDNLLAGLPALVATPELFQPMAESRKEEFLRALRRRMESTSGRIIATDGVRVEFPAGWGLVRASNTSASLSLRFEATDEPGLAALQQLFRAKMAEIDPDLELQF